jgi:hypothetical protein
MFIVLPLSSPIVYNLCMCMIDTFTCTWYDGTAAGRMGRGAMRNMTDAELNYNRQWYIISIHYYDDIIMMIIDYHNHNDDRYPAQFGPNATIARGSREQRLECVDGTVVTSSNGSAAGGSLYALFDHVHGRTDVVSDGKEWRASLSLPIVSPPVGGAVGAAARAAEAAAIAAAVAAAAAASKASSSSSSSKRSNNGLKPDGTIRLQLGRTYHVNRIRIFSNNMVLTLSHNPSRSLHGTDDMLVGIM